MSALHVLCYSLAKSQIAVLFGVTRFRAALLTTFAMQRSCLAFCKCHDFIAACRVHLQYHVSRIGLASTITRLLCAQLRPHSGSVPVYLHLMIILRHG